jgi:hypothetical protein
MKLERLLLAVLWLQATSCSASWVIAEQAASLPSPADSVVEMPGQGHPQAEGPDVIGCREASALAKADSLSTWLEVVQIVRSGEPVQFTMHVHNVSPCPVFLRSSGIQSPDSTIFNRDFTVFTPGGTEVWRLGHGVPFPAGGAHRTLQPGGVLILSWVWDGRDNARKPVRPGQYLVRGYPFVNRPDLHVTEPVPLRIVP